MSIHGYDELAEDDILVSEILEGTLTAEIVEQYPNYHKGPYVLVLQRDHAGRPVHVLWGIAKGTISPAVVVTAYRPDPERWSESFLKRRSP